MEIVASTSKSMYKVRKLKKKCPVMRHGQKEGSIAEQSIGDCSAWCGPGSHLERPVASEVGHTGPTLTGYPVGNQSCIVPKLL